MDKPVNILVCNDDGVNSPGIRALVEVARDFGNVTVVAPDSPQSGMGHAITIGTPLRVHRYHLMDGVDAWECTGTPVDCVKLATGVIMQDKPDLLVSGINHGANYSISVVYSGTMSAAMEGAIEGIPSVGFSLCDHSWDADFTASKEVARTIIRAMLESTPAHDTLLNVNIPKGSLESLKGIRVTRQAIGRWIEEFEERRDPHGQPYYWLSGAFRQEDDGEDTDTWALNNGYVSVCPVEYDLTAHHTMHELNRMHLKLPDRVEK